MKKALVIGASGFAGQYLVQALLSREVEVVAVRHRRPVTMQKNVSIVTGGAGALSASVLRQARPDVIFHFARPVMPALRRLGRVLAARQAARLNRRLINAMRRSELDVPLVFASGSLMYGPSLSPHDENAPLRPFSFARQYHVGEGPILEALNAKDLRITIMRFPWLLGPGSWYEWFYHRPASLWGAVPLFGEGNNLMDIIDVRDAMMAAVEIGVNARFPRVINVGSGNPVAQAGFAIRVAGKYNATVKDHRDVFTGRMEKEALEAFKANIVLATAYPDLLDRHSRHSLEASLDWIRETCGDLRLF